MLLLAEYLILEMENPDKQHFVSNPSKPPNLLKHKQQCITEKFHVRKKRNRFNGMTEEEVLKKTLPDHVAYNLDIIIVSIELMNAMLYFSLGRFYLRTCKRDKWRPFAIIITLIMIL